MSYEERHAVKTARNVPVNKQCFFLAPSESSEAESLLPGTSMTTTTTTTTNDHNHSRVLEINDNHAPEAQQQQHNKLDRQRRQRTNYGGTPVGLVRTTMIHGEQQHGTQKLEIGFVFSGQGISWPLSCTSPSSSSLSSFSVALFRLGKMFRKAIKSFESMYVEVYSYINSRGSHSKSMPCGTSMPQ